jgi:hypothetical protein
MNTETKRDLSVSILRANVVAIFIMVPTAIIQFIIFNTLHGTEKMELTLDIRDILLFTALVFIGIAAHEFIHGLTWVGFGKKPFSMVKFDFQWKTLTPYAHLKEPIEVNVYRVGGFMPGFILGIVPFILSLVLGYHYVFWFSVIHTAAASGDWLILWLLRNVKSGTLVEDHPSRAGCYALEG